MHIAGELIYDNLVIGYESPRYVSFISDSWLLLRVEIELDKRKSTAYPTACNWKIYSRRHSYLFNVSSLVFTLLPCLVKSCPTSDGYHDLLVIASYLGMLQFPMRTDCFLKEFMHEHITCSSVLVFIIFPYHMCPLYQFVYEECIAYCSFLDSN